MDAFLLYDVSCLQPLFQPKGLKLCSLLQAQNLSSYGFLYARQPQSPPPSVTNSQSQKPGEGSLRLQQKGSQAQPLPLQSPDSSTQQVGKPAVPLPTLEALRFGHRQAQERSSTLDWLQTKTPGTVRVEAAARFGALAHRKIETCQAILRELRSEERRIWSGHASLSLHYSYELVDGEYQRRRKEQGGLTFQHLPLRERDSRNFNEWHLAHTRMQPLIDRLDATRKELREDPKTLLRLGPRTPKRQRDATAIMTALRSIEQERTFFGQLEQHGAADRDAYGRRRLEEWRLLKGVRGRVMKPKQRRVELVGKAREGELGTLMGSPSVSAHRVQYGKQTPDDRAMIDYLHYTYPQRQRQQPGRLTEYDRILAQHRPNFVLEVNEQEDNKQLRAR